LNADTIILNNRLASAVQYMKANRIAVLGPMLRNEDGTLQVSFKKKNTLNKQIFDVFSLAFPLKGLIRRISKKSIELPKSPSPMGFLVGAALVISSNAVQKFGLFDESYFFTGEERDFCLKMLRANQKIVYFPEFKIIHYGGSGDPHSTFHLLNWFKSSCILAQNHGSFLSLILMKSGLSLFYLNSFIIYWCKHLFCDDEKIRKLPKKYFYLFLWSIGSIDEKRLY
jgi:hypothetical protein